MVDQGAMANLTELERYIVLENVIEHLSHGPTLVSISAVSRRANNALYRANGLREITFGKLDGACSAYQYGYCPMVCGVHVHCDDDRFRERVKKGMRWFWIIGQRVHTLRLIPGKSWSMYDDVVKMWNKFTYDSRSIERLEITRVSPKHAIDLITENKETLRFLSFEFTQLCRDDSLYPPYFLTELGQCEFVESVDVIVDRDNSTSTIELLTRLPLKYLRLYLDQGYTNFRTSLLNFINVSWFPWFGNLCKSLECLSLQGLDLNFGQFVSALAGQNQPMTFKRLKTLSFDFIELCHGEPLNWLAFWTVFPVVKTIRIDWKSEKEWRHGCAFQRHDVLKVKQEATTFCKRYLEALGNLPSESRLEIASFGRPSDADVVGALVEAVTLPDDQEWCSAHGVQVLTESREEVIERVTLRKDAASLVFTFKHKEE